MTSALITPFASYLTFRTAYKIALKDINDETKCQADLV